MEGRHSSGGGQKPAHSKLFMPGKGTWFLFYRQQRTVKQFLAEEEINIFSGHFLGCERNTFEGSEFKGREIVWKVAVAV